MNNCIRASRREFIILAATFGPAISRINAAPQEGGRGSVTADQALRELLDGKPPLYERKPDDAPSQAGRFSCPGAWAIP